MATQVPESPKRTQPLVTVRDQAKRIPSLTSMTTEELVEIIQRSERRRRYGLVWDEEHTPEDIVLSCRNRLPVLKLNTRDGLVETEHDTNHILIRGDNYHALSVLSYTHRSEIDLIYIDPSQASRAKWMTLLIASPHWPTPARRIQIRSFMLTPQCNLCMKRWPRLCHYLNICKRCRLNLRPSR